MHELRLRGRAEVEAFEQRQLLQEHRALPPRAGLEHRVAAVVERKRLLKRRGPAGRVVTGQEPVLRPHETVDRSRDEARVPRVPGARDLPLACAAGRLPEDVPVRRRDARTAKERPRFRRREEDLG